MKILQKKFILLFLIFPLSSFNIGQSDYWTCVEVKNADTARQISYLKDAEKDVIKYINLCRLYPKKYIQFLKFYIRENAYRNSLISQLQTIKPLKPLHSDKSLTEYADCFSQEQSETGYVGHERKKCKYGYFAECCAYGMNSGKEIALQLLVDEDVESLGHRIICLSSSCLIGVSINTHKIYGTCAVLDFQ